MFTKDGFTGGINYYRANLTYFPKEGNGKIGDGDGGLFIMGQRDKYISQASCILMADFYPKLQVEVVPNANHFVQQDAPHQVNKLMKDFLGDASGYAVE